MSSRASRPLRQRPGESYPLGATYDGAGTTPARRSVDEFTTIQQAFKICELVVFVVTWTLTDLVGRAFPGLDGCL